MTGADTLALLHQCRAVLELAWPIMRRTGVMPEPPAGAPASTECCIHSSLFVQAALSRAMPEMVWQVVGGAPTDRSLRGGYTDARGESHMHCWVVGASADLPGVPLYLADLTADQFGGPPVRWERVPVQGYRANLAPAVVYGFAHHERKCVCLLLEMLAASEHLAVGQPEMEDSHAR